MSYYDNTHKKSINDSRNRKRYLLRKHNARCYWCHREVFLAPSGVTYKDGRPWNIATLDHIYHRWDIRRALSREVVLSCLECNENKGKEFTNLVYQDYRQIEEIDILKLFNN